MPKRPGQEVVDTSWLTDADWVEINKLRNAYESGGQKALSKAMKELENDPIRWVRVMGAFLPELIREQIKDAMADWGMTEDHLRELIRKLESHAGKQ